MANKWKCKYKSVFSRIFCLAFEMPVFSDSRSSDAEGKAVHWATLPLCLWWMFLILEMTISEHKGGQPLLKAGWTLRPPSHQALRPVGVLIEINTDLQQEIEHSLCWTEILSTGTSRNWIFSHNPWHTLIYLPEPHLTNQILFFSSLWLLFVLPFG